MLMWLLLMSPNVVEHRVELHRKDVVIAGRPGHGHDPSHGQWHWSGGACRGGGYALPAETAAVVGMERTSRTAVGRASHGHERGERLGMELTCRPKSVWVNMRHKHSLRTGMMHFVSTRTGMTHLHKFDDCPYTLIYS